MDTLTVDIKELKKRFLSRLRTQERAYNDLEIYYTPRLYPKLLKNSLEHKENLRKLYLKLIDEIEIELINNSVVKFSNIDTLYVEQLELFALTKCGRIKVKDFQGCTSIRDITLDHTIPFYDLISNLRDRLPILKRLSFNIRNGSNNLTKEQMRIQYERVSKIPIDLNCLLSELELLAGETKLRLMLGKNNFSKGKSRGLKTNFFI
ncbi:MAG TPA: hypothetical protein VN721_06600 [Flavipsychrobacter sp.]|nr:hypothetical protein [Flavipsychrobacter sp.]